MSSAAGRNIPTYQALNFELATQMSTKRMRTDFSISRRAENSFGTLTYSTPRKTRKPSRIAPLIAASAASWNCASGATSFERFS
jgi:hypothetical protein